MTKEEILEYFKDINHAYNDCTRYDTLKRMIDELQKPKTGHWMIHIDYDYPVSGSRGYCSVCSYGNVDLLDGRPHSYCSNCGAMMVGII